MEENKELQKLKDDELEQVSSGYSKSGNIEYFEVGDCFERPGGSVIYVINAPTNSRQNIVSYDQYDERAGGEWYAYSYSKRSSYISCFVRENVSYIGKKDTCGRTFKYGPNDK